MDWLFGRKKSEVKTEDAKEAIQVVDDFVMYPALPTHPSYPPSFPSMPSYPPHYPGHSVPPSSSHHHMPSLPPMNYAAKSHTNPLDSVPFQLSSKLDSNGASRIPPEVKRIGTFLANVKRSVDSSDFTYDFKLEHSVLRETSAFNGL